MKEVAHINICKFIQLQVGSCFEQAKLMLPVEQTANGSEIKNSIKKANDLNQKF